MDASMAITLHTIWGESCRRLRWGKDGHLIMCLWCTPNDSASPPTPESSVSLYESPSGAVSLDTKKQAGTQTPDRTLSSGSPTPPTPFDPLDGGVPLPALAP